MSEPDEIISNSGVYCVEEEHWPQRRNIGCRRGTLAAEEEQIDAEESLFNAEVRQINAEVRQIDEEEEQTN